MYVLLAMIYVDAYLNKNKMLKTVLKSMVFQCYNEIFSYAHKTDQALLGSYEQLQRKLVGVMNTQNFETFNVIFHIDPHILPCREAFESIRNIYALRKNCTSGLHSIENLSKNLR